MGYCIIPLNLEIHNFRNLYGLMCIKRAQIPQEASQICE